MSESDRIRKERRRYAERVRSSEPPTEAQLMAARAIADRRRIIIRHRALLTGTQWRVGLMHKAAHLGATPHAVADEPIAITEGPKGWYKGPFATGQELQRFCRFLALGTGSLTRHHVNALR
jgi:hypothetical protein